MIHLELNEATGVAIIRPEKMIGLSETDFKQLTDLVDHYLKNNKTLRGLIIASEKFPGWEDLIAFISHIRFIRNHHRVIKKVAFVSNSLLLPAAPYFFDHFVNAKVKSFSFSDIEQAKTWVASEEVSSGRFLMLEGYPDNVVALLAEGIITHNDYEKILIPLIEEKIRTHKKVKLLYWCGEEFRGFSAGAVWDDARFGMTHLADFQKIALVSDIEWVRQSVKLFAPFIKVPVQIFHNTDIEGANRWIIED